MRLGKMLSVGEVVEQPPVEEPAPAPPEPARLETAAAAARDDQAEVPAGARARG
jgi:hypothetical protein